MLNTKVLLDLLNWRPFETTFEETTLVKIVWKLYEARYERKTVSLEWQVTAVPDNAGKKLGGAE